MQCAATVGRLSLFIAIVASTWPAQVIAQPKLTSRWSNEKYALHGSIAGVSLVGALVANELLTPANAEPRWDSCFDFEQHVDFHMSVEAAAWSDQLLFVSLSAPTLLHIGDGADRQLANHAFIYGEAIGVQLLITVGVKHLARRARPYTHNTDRRVKEFSKNEKEDAILSFYSGHASTAFVSSVAGAYLFGAKTDSAMARGVSWFIALFSATATAHLRVIAGRHYYTDVLAGALVGVGLGIAIPYAHGNRYQPSLEDVAAMAGGCVAGALLPLAWQGDQTVRIGWPSKEAEVSLMPLAGPSIAGLSLRAILGTGF